MHIGARTPTIHRENRPDVGWLYANGDYVSVEISYRKDVSHDFHSDKSSIGERKDDDVVNASVILCAWVQRSNPFLLQRLPGEYD